MQTWRNDSPTRFGIDVYTTGDCWILAYYLAKRLDNIVGCVGGYMWDHVVAAIPGTNLYLDITGVNTKSHLVNDAGYAWHSKKIHRMDIGGMNFSDYRLSLSNIEKPLDPPHEVYGMSERTHSRTAKRLIEKHLIREVPSILEKAWR